MNDSRPDYELNEFGERGIEYLLQINEKRFIPWWSVVSVTLLGVIQMMGGVVLVGTGFGANLGMALITEGAADIFMAYWIYSNR